MPAPSDLPPPAATPPAPDNLTGALWMLGSAAGFAVMSVLVKMLGPDVGLGTLIFWRCAAGVAASIPFALMAGKGGLRVARPMPMLLRSSWSTLGFFLGFHALIELPLADSQALSFSRPLFITILAVILLKETVAWRRWTAVAVGFIGIVLMAKPGAALEWATFSALGSAFCFACAIITVKDLTRDHSPISLVFWTNLFTALAGLPFLFLDPALPDLSTLGLLLAMGVGGVVAQGCYVRALAVGEASLVGLVDYVRLPLAIGAGLVFFNTVPDGLALTGAAIVVASTAYITLREARVKKGS
ncbi:MAG: DMT family transporter [Hyphomonadaceae bacterium]|nr:DMT family transporter [Hyphomonadaceae bacterium]